MSVPVFIEIEPTDQVSELKVYLKSKGVEVSEEIADVESSLTEIVSVSDQLLKEGSNEGDLELIFNSVIALVIVQPTETREVLVNSLCEKLQSLAVDKMSSLRLRLLYTLFYGLEERCPLRYEVFMAMIKLAGTQPELLKLVDPKLDDVKSWMPMWDVSAAKMQTLLRALYDAYTNCKQSEQATNVMLELLATYTEENASQAREDAHKCIVTSLADPKTLLYDHLLTLKPIKFLEGELIHDLLTIFVSGKIQQYMEFHLTNKDFVSSLGLSHDDNVQKMRLLTFMQIAEGKTELSFDTIQQELQLELDDVEAFIIDVVRTKAVKAKMDQPSRRVIVTMTTNRTFGRPQWQQLDEQLRGWQVNVSQVLAGFMNVQKMVQQQQQQQTTPR